MMRLIRNRQTFFKDSQVTLNMWVSEFDSIFEIQSGDTIEHMFRIEPSEHADVLYFYIEQFLDSAECIECAAETFDVADALKKTKNELKDHIIENGKVSKDVYQQ